jgi:putative two-component system response regulator
MMDISDHKPKVLLVDDAPENVDILGQILKPYYKRSVAMNGEKALRIASSQEPPDLILLDIVMPDMDGYEVCRRLKDDEATRNIPVIFVTGKAEVEDETKGFELGAVDYITKPVSPAIVLARVKTHLELKQAREYLKHENEILESKVKERTLELALTQEVTIHSLASLAETRDNETGGHIRRTQHYVRLLAEYLCTSPGFSAFLDEETIDLLYKSAPLHDIGKVGVPDAILLKPGKLTTEEFEEMKKHTVYGRDAILTAEKAFGDRQSSSFLRLARAIAYSHHERWDGRGYPEGLAGEDIPVPGRLMALADVYDALISRRVYKPPLPHRQAVEIIAEGQGTQFDPDVTSAFLEITDDFRRIALEFADHDDERGALEG